MQYVKKFFFTINHKSMYKHNNVTFHNITLATSSGGYDYDGLTNIGVLPPPLVMVCYDLAHQIRWAKHSFTGRCDFTPMVCCSFGGHSAPQFLQCRSK